MDAGLRLFGNMGYFSGWNLDEARAMSCKLFDCGRIGSRLMWLLLAACPTLWALSFPTLEGDHYTLTIQSRLQPPAINRIHSWELELRNCDGELVSGANIQISGGMPGHDHGLPTAPRVTRELSPGRYLLEGMKFQMGGEWEVNFRIDAPPGKDKLTLSFAL